MFELKLAKSFHSVLTAHIVKIGEKAAQKLNSVVNLPPFKPDKQRSSELVTINLICNIEIHF